jgi:putative spermidine/putrescine transport system permease protein
MNTVSLDLPLSATAHRRNFTAILGLSPAMCLLVIFFALPMGMMIAISFHDPETGRVGLHNYTRFLTDGLSLRGFWRTALMSGLVALSATLLAYPVAYYLARSTSRWRSMVFALALAPELAGVVLRTYGWLIILEDRGFINDTFIQLGLISSPLPLAKNLFAVVVGLTHVVLPFAILSLTTSIQGIDDNLERAAQMLGAPRHAVLRYILLPLSVPGLVSSFLLSFTMAASAYATPALLGGAGFKVLATMISEQVLFYIDWPFAAVMANALLILMLGISYAGIRFEATQRARRNGQTGARP